MMVLLLLYLQLLLTLLQMREGNHNVCDIDENS